MKCVSLVLAVVHCTVSAHSTVADAINFHPKSIQQHHQVLEATLSSDQRQGDGFVNAASSNINSRSRSHNNGDGKPTTTTVAPFLFSSSSATFNVSQIHLALGATPFSATISWMCDAPSIAMFGHSADDLFLPVAPISSKPYKMVSIPRNTSEFLTYTSGVINHAPVTGLLPNKQYFYQIVGLSNDSGVVTPSKVASFTTAPAVGDQTPFTFDVVGDLGQTSDSLSTLQHMAQDFGPNRNRSSIIMHAGDMSYADCFNPRWDSYFDLIEPLASHVPWMVAAGNHEIEPNNISGHIMDPYKARYAMPSFLPTVDTTLTFQNPANHGFDCTPSAYTGSYDFGNSFYSFRAGMVHFIVLNSYTRTDNSSNQYAWLTAELSFIDREVTPWVVAMWHSPWYNSNHDHHDEFNTVAMRASMESMLVDAGVNIVFNGHVHAYERTHPVAFNRTGNPKAPIYIVVGDGGNREGHADKYKQVYNWSAFHNASDFGHGRFSVLNTTHALWEWHINNAAEWVVSDSVVLENAMAPSFPNSTCNATELVMHHSGPPSSCVFDSSVSGHRTIGYSFDMELPSSRGIFTRLGLNFDSVFFGDQCLNQTEIDALLNIQLQSAVKQTLNAVGPTYQSVCCNVANALVDMAYNMSFIPNSNIDLFRPTIYSILARNYTEAAKYVNESAWCHRIPDTCQADIALIAAGC